jgi:hypothetical protein
MGGADNLRFGEEIYTDSGLIVTIKIIIHKPCNDARFAYTLVT